MANSQLCRSVEVAAKSRITLIFLHPFNGFPPTVLASTGVLLANLTGKPLGQVAERGSASSMAFLG